MSNLFIDPTFLARCSEKTLQTNEKGFFLKFADHVALTAGENWITSVFGQLTTDKDRIRSIYAYKPVKEAVCETLMHVQEIYRKKSADVSFKRRLEAETLFKKDELTKALILSSQAVLRAPPTGTSPGVDDGFTLSMAYWNRAEVFMALQKYSFALSDIKEALKEELFDHLKFEAYCKMGICYKMMGEKQKAEISFNLALKFSSSNNMEAFQKKINDYRNFELPQEKKTADRRVLPLVSEGKHPEIPNASRKVAILKESEKGSYMIAKDPITTGDVVVVEEPYASCLLPDSFGTNCHHCFEKLIAPVGCHDCSGVAFCKVECRKAALSKYHQFECHFLDLLVGSGMSILCHTALRMITQNSLEENLRMYNNKATEKIFGLCTNDQLRSPEDAFQRTIMACFLLRCLQKSGYFTDGEANEEVTPNEEEFCIGELLLLYLQILQFNAHEIYETRYSSSHRFKSSKAVYIGVAIYVTAALFNHDCYPAVTRHFVGKKIVLTAVRPLQPGEAIGENYGPIFTKRPLAVRQRSLSSRYWFSCKCQACEQNWPSFDEKLEEASVRLRCPNKKCTNHFTLPIKNENLTCPRCHRKVSMTNSIMEMKVVEEQYEEARKALESEDPQKAISLLCAAINKFHRISTPPHYRTHLAQEVLRCCLADSGNTSLMEN